MVSNISVNSRNQFSKRQDEKARQRVAQLQSRNGNNDIVRSPSASGVAQPVKIAFSFGRP